MADSEPFIGIIGGSGLGEALGAQKGEARHVQTPFGPPSSPLTLTRWDGVQVAIIQRHGPGHVFGPARVPYRANVFALKAVGATHIIASGATGSLRDHIRPGDLVIPDQVIDKTIGRPSTFYEKAVVHVEMADPFCPMMRRWLIAASRRLDGTTVHDKGTYVCMEGPAFSTRAESHMHRNWEADLIGMTCMPEAKLAREAEIAYALISLPTDYDCWRQGGPHGSAEDLLQEILGNLQRATQCSIALIREALSDVSMLRSEPSPAHGALELAIWTDKSKIPPDEIERLRVLWGRHFA